MKKYGWIALIFVGTVLASTSAWAGGCRYETVSTSKELASNYVGTELRAMVLDIEKRMAAKGQTMKAVMIARAGDLLNKMELLKDDPSVPYLDYAYDRAKKAKARFEGRLYYTNKRGKKVFYSDRSSRLPDHDYSKEKMIFTHLGFLVKTNPRITGDEKINDWQYVIHLLAECDEKKKRYGASQIFFETLDRFFWDSKILESHKKKHKNGRKTIVLVPTPEIQENIWLMTQRREIAEDELHEPRYNAAAVPYEMLTLSKKLKNEEAIAKNIEIRKRNEEIEKRNKVRVAKGKKPKRLKKLREIKYPEPAIHQLTDQNSNQWPLEVLAASTKPYGEINTRKMAQQLLWDTNYRPTLARPGGIKNNVACSMVKGLFNIIPLWNAENILSCKKQKLKDKGISQLITVHSVIEYMKRANLFAESVYEAGQPGIYRFEAQRDMLEIMKSAGETSDKINCTVAAHEGKISPQCQFLPKNERERILITAGVMKPKNDHQRRMLKKANKKKRSKKKK